MFACSSSSDDGGASATTVDAKDSGARDAKVATDSGSSSSDASSSPTDASTNDSGAGDAKADVIEASSGVVTCSAVTSFPAILLTPEASSAAEVELTSGVRELIVVSDSGNGGKALLIGIPGGATRSLTLPLDDKASDDLEGSAWRDQHLYTLTSSGAVRRFSPDGKGGLARDQDVYAIGPAPYACSDLMGINCGKNYEGLCLRASSISAKCAGYAASKAEGKLYCVTVDGAGKLAVDTSASPIDLGIPADQLSDCAFGAPGGPAEHVLIVGVNVGGGSKTYRVDEATGKLTVLNIASLLNEEAAAIDKDGSLYAFDDNNYGVSGAAKATCSGW